MAPAQPIHVLLVEHDQSDARRLMQMLRAARDAKFRLQRARRFHEAQRRLETGGADIVLLDIGLPDVGGLESVLTAQQIAPGIPLVVLHAEPDNRLAAEALEQGVQDFLVKAELNSGQLSRALLYDLARHRWHASVRNLSLVDDLTGLHNRRGFITLAEQRLKLTARRGIRSSLVFVDLDDLKGINDTFGHPEGDRALKQVAGMFKECLRESDIVARLGGDEFCALLTDASESSRELIRQRLGQALEVSNTRPESRYLLSVSMGIVEVGTLLALDHEMARADASMYEEKRGKRTRTASKLPTPSDHALV